MPSLHLERVIVGSPFEEDDFAFKSLGNEAAEQLEAKNRRRQRMCIEKEASVCPRICFVSQERKDLPRYTEAILAVDELA